MSSGERYAGTLATDIVVYLVLLGMAGLQILLAYHSSEGRGLLARMMVVAAVQAVIAVTFFMHLRWERGRLVVAIAVVSLFVLASMQFSWSDSFRLLHMSPWTH